MTDSQKEIKNLRLCLRIHFWGSIALTIFWMAAEGFIYIRHGRIQIVGLLYLLMWALVYYGLRMKLRSLEKGSSSG
jgi:hypothetical protein